MDLVKKINSESQAFWWLNTYVARNGGKYRLESTNDGFTLYIEVDDPDLVGYRDVFAKSERKAVNGMNMEWRHPNLRTIEANHYSESYSGKSVSEALEKHFENFHGHVKTFLENRDHGSARNFITDQEGREEITAEEFMDEFEINKSRRFITTYIDQ